MVNAVPPKFFGELVSGDKQQTVAAENNLLGSHRNVSAVI